MNGYLSVEEQKRLVGRFSIETLLREGVLHNGMKLGMGTGSTIEYVIIALSECLNRGELKDIAVVPTSDGTLARCEDLGIPIYSLNSRRIEGCLELCIDGADRVDSNKNLIKGGGAALLREKIVSYNSNVFVVVIDESKKTDSLNCDFPLPIEVIPFAYKSVCLALKKRGLSVKLREGNAKIGPTITDNGNYILDIKYPDDFNLDPKKEEIELNRITGIVENGFFTNVTKIRVFASTKDGKVESY